MAALVVSHPGMLTLLQDLGRLGAAEQGISQGGALDLHAACWANYLVGNGAEAPVLEVTLGQAQFTATNDCVFVLTGAEMQATLDGEPVVTWQSGIMRQGQTLKLGFARHGLRAYLAIQGGFHVPTVLGSCATVVRNQLGGLAQGQPLVASDRVPFKGMDIELQDRTDSPHIRLPHIPPRFVPDYAASITLRVVESYQAAHFQPLEKAKFYASHYTVTQETDRMGCRLDGEPIQCEVEGIISEGIAQGSIQIPPNGQPIVLLNDRQTLGGYPKLGCVARVDLPRLAQARPGTKVHFQPGNLEALTEEWQQFSRFFALPF
ncbi:biotin-dependent carboxyltransferase family protein [Photobacterium japonica]|uniref:5-oxoprolinase subunit C family protein n=1 Tax=Photobacterium japonica TaxID=2910235 RepID=UPI003D0C399E